MSNFEDLFLKIGCVLIVIGLALVIFHSWKPEIFSEDLALAFLAIGFFPIFFNFLEAIFCLIKYMIELWR